MAKAKKEPATKEVAKTAEAALPISAEELAAMSGQGFENADSSAYAIPFLRVLQTNSPQCNPDEASYIEGARGGYFFNTVTGKLYGKEVLVIPITYKRDFVEWLPNRGGYVKSHGSDPSIMERVVEVDDKNNSILDNGNIIQDSRNHFILIADDLTAGPIIFSLSSTGIRHSKKWMSLLSNLRTPIDPKKQPPMFLSMWRIATTINENEDGKWYQIGDRSTTLINFEGWVDEEMLEAGRASFKLINSGNTSVDYASTVDGKEKDDVPF